MNEMKVMTLIDYTQMLDTAERALVLDTLRWRGVSRGLEPLYAPIADAIEQGRDINFDSLAGAMLPGELEEERLWLGSMVEEPRQYDPPSRMFCWLSLHLARLQIKKRGRMNINNRLRKCFGVKWSCQ